MYLDKVIYDTHWQDNNKKQRSAVADDNNSSHDT